jgi:ElaB/YqjD/DUF883 family membrane-anchored ribosome-binding protein
MDQNEQYGFPRSESESAGGRGNGSDSASEDASGKVRDSLATARQKLSDTMSVAQDRSREMMDTTSGYIHRWPFGSIAVAAGVGLLIGLMLGRGASESSMSRRSWW